MAWLKAQCNPLNLVTERVTGQSKGNSCVSFYLRQNKFVDVCGAVQKILIRKTRIEVHKKKSISDIGVRAISFASVLYLERGLQRKMCGR